MGGEPSWNGDRAGLDLKEATLSGVRWTAFARVAAEAAALGSTLILAHLVSPADFGRATIALIAVSVAAAFLTQGIATALVQLRQIERKHVEVGFLISTGLGVLLALLLAAVAHLAVRPIFDDSTANLMVLTAPAFVLAGAAAVPYALLQRELDFQHLGLAEVAGTALAALASVAMAVAGLNAEAVVLGAVVLQGTSTVVLFIRARIPFPRWHAKEARELLSFGLPAALGSLAYVGFRNVDYALIGARLGASSVGFYWRGYQLAVDYQGKVSGIMLRMAFPLYSRAENLDVMRRLRARVVRVHAVCLLPPLAALIAVAPIFVPWAYGAQWEPAVVPTQILAVAGMVAVIVTGMGPLMLAAGYPRALLWWNVATTVVYGIVVYFLAPYGIVAICVGITCTQALSLVGSQYLLLQRLVGIPVRQLKHDAGPGLAAAAAVLAVTYPLVLVLDRGGVPAALVLAAAGITTLVVWTATLKFFFPAAWADFQMLYTRVLGRKKQAPLDVAEAPAGSHDAGSAGEQTEEQDAAGSGRPAVFAGARDTDDATD
jgi:PST family polysaccharide transporter